MSEKLRQHQSHEKLAQHETEHTNHEKKLLKEHQEKAKNTHETSEDSIEKIKQSIESVAIDRNDYQIGEKEHEQSHSYATTKQIKTDSYKRTLNQVQKKLNKTEKALSKTIHNPAVEKVSEIGSKTVARPSGLLFGGIFAFIGSLTVLIISKRSGFSYNYLLFALVFIGGYFIGLIFELFYRILKPNKR